MGAVLSSLAILGCSSHDHPPPADFSTGGTPEVPDGGVLIGGSSGAPATCGGQRIEAVLDPPTLYFVLDRSGSMQDSIEGSSENKYATARSAVATLLRAIGHRVRYGAAVFPSAVNDDTCDPGRQVFQATLGDPASYAANGMNGPLLQDLLRRLSVLGTGGGTPTAATLATLAPTLEGLGENTYVILATDGAPNCNQAASCGSDRCIPDLEQLVLGSEVCGVSRSCCDPDFLGVGAGQNCIDDEAETRVAELFEAGIQTFVIGMPGSGAYASLLDRLAQAGGTARSSGPAYYAVDDTDALTEALFEIGTGVAIECEIELETEPVREDLVNVYLDGEVLPFEPDDGWEWTAADTISLRGDACARLTNLKVLEVEVIYGCETVVPR